MRGLFFCPLLGGLFGMATDSQDSWCILKDFIFPDPG